MTMRFELQEIDEIYRSIEGYIEPSSISQVLDIAQRDGTELSRKREEAQLKYNHAIQKYRAIASQLSPQDVIQGYQEGGLLLRLNLIDRMSQDYSPLYASLMIQAIQDKHKGADRLLATLAENMTIGDLAEVLIGALNSGMQKLEEMALDITRHFKFAEMRPALEKFLAENPEKVEIIRGILADLPMSEPPKD